MSRDWQFYCDVLKAGRAFYNYEYGSLSRVYHEVGRFNEVSMEHLRAMYTKYTK